MGQQVAQIHDRYTMMMNLPYVHLELQILPILEMLVLLLQYPEAWGNPGAVPKQLLLLPGCDPTRLLAAASDMPQAYLDVLHSTLQDHFHTVPQL
jgi:hypothetical protein